jgi:hypothetical protein
MSSVNGRGGGSPPISHPPVIDDLSRSSANNGCSSSPPPVDFSFGCPIQICEGQPPMIRFLTSFTVFCCHPQ